MWRPRFLLSISMLLFSLSLISSLAIAELTPDQRNAAQALIAQLSAPEFAARQQAVEKLIALGAGVLPLVKKTLAETADVEVKMRCEMVLKGIEKDHGVRPDGTPLPRPPNLDASRVTLDVKEVPLAKVLEIFAKESGNAAPVVPKEFREKPVTLALKDVPYWQAVDALCRTTGLTWSHGMRLLERPEGFLDVGAYAGPTALRITNAERVVFFHTRSRRDWQLRSYVEYGLMCCPESRLVVTSMAGRVTGAWRRDGTPLTVREGSFGAPDAFSIAVEEPLAPGERIARLEGELRIEVAVGEREMKLPDVLSGAERKVEDEGVSLTVSNGRRDRNTAGLELEMSTSRGMIREQRGAVEPRYGFFLVAPDGKRHVPEVHSGPNASHNLRGTLGVAAELPPAEDMRFHFGMAFRNLDDAPGAWSLVYIYPDRREILTHRFEIRDVPVP